MNKRKGIIIVAVLVIALFIVSACTALMSPSTEGSGKSRQTQNINIYKPFQPDNQGDPDDMGGGLRNTW